MIFICIYFIKFNLINNKTVLYTAVEKNDIDMVRFLLSRQDINLNIYSIFLSIFNCDILT